MTQGLVLTPPRSPGHAREVTGVGDRHRSVLLGAATAGALAALATANGGYYAPAWGWSSFIAAAVAAVALIWGVRMAPLSARDRVRRFARIAPGLDRDVLAWSENVPRTVLEVQRAR